MAVAGICPLGLQPLPLLVLVLVLGAVLPCGGGGTGYPLAADGTAWAHPGWQCLRRTTPGLELRYPDDAEAHFDEIHQVLARYSEPPKGHSMTRILNTPGPWTENFWIRRARAANLSRAEHSLPLRAVFGPFVPLLLNWMDTWHFGRMHYPRDFKVKLLKLLRPTVPYLTVSQHGQGITAACELSMQALPNVLVVSGGGYGHLAIPTLYVELKPLEPPPVEERRFFATYVGSMSHSPFKLRYKMWDILKAFTAKNKVQGLAGKKTNWTSIMLQSKFSLVPRGYGRTAYHLAETIQLGLIPVYIYSDVAWVPYPKLFAQFGYAVTVDELPALLESLLAMPGAEHRRREALSRRYRRNWCVSGTLDQISNYSVGLPSDLQCVALPPDERGVGPCTNRTGLPANSTRSRRRHR